MLDSARVEMLAYQLDKRAYTLRVTIVFGAVPKKGLLMCRRQRPFSFPSLVLAGPTAPTSPHVGLTCNRNRAVGQHSAPPGSDSSRLDSSNLSRKNAEGGSWELSTWPFIGCCVRAVLSFDSYRTR